MQREKERTGGKAKQIIKERELLDAGWLAGALREEEGKPAVGK